MIERRDQSVRDVLHRVMGLSSECDELDLGIMIMEVWWTEPTVIYLIVKGLLKQLSVRLWSNRRQLKLVSLTIFECGLGWFLLFYICTISSKWETARTEIPHCHHKLWFAKPHVGAYVVMHVTTTIALNSPKSTSSTHTWARQSAPRITDLSSPYERNAAEFYRANAPCRTYTIHMSSCKFGECDVYMNIYMFICRVSVGSASAIDANAQAINPIGIDTCPHFYTIAP